MLEQSAVGQAGKAVVVGKAMDMFGVLALDTDIADDADEAIRLPARISQQIGTVANPVCFSVRMDDPIFEFGPAMFVEQVALVGDAGFILLVYAGQPVTAVVHENLGLDAVDAFYRG